MKRPFPIWWERVLRYQLHLVVCCRIHLASDNSGVPDHHPPWFSQRLVADK